MNCPACGNATTEQAAGDIHVDVCTACGGIWFDNHELMKVDEPHESAGEALLASRGHPTTAVDHEERLRCPQCEDVHMRRFFFSVKREVEVDECPMCGGVWLDVGELALIRDQFDSEEERRQAAEAYFDEIFGERLEGMRAEGDERAGKARRLARVFRFLCPSYYIPGKQKWGAF